MERNIIESLKEWKNNPKRKPLILTGVRQCGKTYAVSQFGENEFSSFVYCNFEKDETLASIFAYDFDVRRIVEEISNIVGKIEVGETLLFFDEIQTCPRAITALKYFCEDMRALHLIAAGSLLGVALKGEGVSFPVGKVNHLQMYPMSFDEFVAADGGAGLIAGVKKMALEREIPDAFSVPLSKHLKNYYVVGGMPEVVQSWVDTHDYQQAAAIQDDIISGYTNDFSKHAPLSDVPKIAMIWESVPVQLAKENNKFVFSHVKKGLRAKDLEDALRWLVDAGLIYRHKLVENPEIPLSGMMDETYFKVFAADVGLLCRKARINYRSILEEDERFIRYKGAIAENFVLSQLLSMGIESCFWRSGATAEVDFLTDYEGRLMPIEVKSAEHTKAKSFQLFCARYHPRMGMKFSLKNVGDYYEKDTHVWNIPLYAIYRIKEYSKAGSRK